jgi:NAD(P)-dependent dehydrogenase (short-subunit alcohol dehydrogenase family)
MDRLSGKTAVVTGGASGIGAAIVRRFAGEGARVIIADIDDLKGPATGGEIGATYVRHDVAKPESWAVLGDVLRALDVTLDILVNNAGVITGRTIEQLELEVWSRTLDINLTGTMLGCKFAIEEMRRSNRKSGSIINMASTAGYMGTAADVAYSASKGGIRLLTKAVANHCASQGLGIRCNAILPGTVETDIVKPLAEAHPEVLDLLRSMSPMRRLAQPEEIAAMAAFLASDDASYCTGGDYVVDGGLLSAHPGPR